MRHGPRHVERSPDGDAVAEVFAQDSRIIRVIVGKIAIGPTTFVFERLRKIPMIKRTKGTNTRSQDRIDKPGMVVEPFLVRRSGAKRLDPWPRNRKTIAFEIHLLDDRQVVREEMVVITSDVSRSRASNLARSMRKAVPVRVTFSVLFTCAFH